MIRCYIHPQMILFVFVYAFVYQLVVSCHRMTLTNCRKGHRSPHQPCSALKTLKSKSFELFWAPGLGWPGPGSSNIYFEARLVGMLELFSLTKVSSRISQRACNAAPGTQPTKGARGHLCSVQEQNLLIQIFVFLERFTNFVGTNFLASIIHVFQCRSRPLQLLQFLNFMSSFLHKKKHQRFYR